MHKAHEETITQLLNRPNNLNFFSLFAIDFVQCLALLRSFSISIIDADEILCKYDYFYGLKSSAASVIHVATFVEKVKTILWLMTGELCRRERESVLVYRAMGNTSVDSL
jgi:hypothetical protein